MANYLSILAETIRTNRDQPALTDFYLTEDGTAQDTSRGNRYTYGGMYAELCRVAELLTSLGLQKGDHIAICGANSAHWCIAYLAIAKMQGVSVTVMHSLMPDEIARLVDFSDAKALFTDADIWAELKSQSIPQVESVIGLENWEVLKGKMQIISLPFREELEVGFPSFPQSAPDDLAMICFTSGTSSNARGVLLSTCILSNTLFNSNLIYPLDSNIINLSILPYSHILGLCDMLTHIIRGKNICIYQGTLSAPNLFTAIKILQPYSLCTIPVLVTLMVKNSAMDFVKQAKQTCFMIGGAPLPKEIETFLSSNGIRFTIGYGSTESGCLIASSIWEKRRSQSCGLPIMGTTITFSPAGEILVKGENVMLGYYKDPEATAAKIDSDGWLHTGDKGHLDEDGYLYVEGRLEQDIIVLPNGENIRPDTIEALINALPEVSESLVLARDGHLVAIVVPSSPSLEGRAGERLSVLRTVNPQLPLFSQLYDVEITSEPLARTEKQTIKRYLYK